MLLFSLFRALLLAGFTPAGFTPLGFTAPGLAAPDPTPAPTDRSPRAIVLGIAQDGGVPHAGCRQELCVRARRDPSARLAVASLGLVDPAAGKRFLIDATPDFGEQIERLGGRPDGILLTHAHVGHYLGLAQLGREVMGTRRLPVYATASMAGFLRANLPWSRLVKLENIVIQEIAPGREIALTPALRVTPILVPHRDEDSDTVAYLVRGTARTLLWLPDIDRWEQWDRRLGDLFADPSLVAFVDGTFYSADEIPGRSIADIPHPLVPDTLRRLADSDVRDRLFFVHLNHTNPLLRHDDAAVSAITKRGARVASQGQVVELGSAAAEPRE
jgi:pyrroloquinoline quinone biosynthesis protein B